VNATSPRACAWLPVIRLVSRRVLPLLARTPATANQLTVASLLLGLAAALCYATGERGLTLIGAALVIGCYVLDNCDGDLARLRGTSSRFGAVLDTAVDCVVHMVLFAAIGFGLTRASGDLIWTWLGLAATAGATINSVIAMRRELRGAGPVAAPGSPQTSPHGPGEWVLFAFRELSRADFCFLLALATAAGVHGWLLAASAAGAQAYWVSALSRAAQRFQVR
jgi:phosphatidylglycerophosphate synthase